MLTIYLDLVNHKLLSKLMIYENIWVKNSVAYPISVLVPTIPDTSGSIPDTSGIHRTETLTLCPWPYRTRPVVISDTSGRCRTDTINSLLVIPRLALVFIVH